MRSPNHAHGPMKRYLALPYLLSGTSASGLVRMVLASEDATNRIEAELPLGKRNVLTSMEHPPLSLFVSGHSHWQYVAFSCCVVLPHSLHFKASGEYRLPAPSSLFVLPGAPLLGPDVATLPPTPREGPALEPDDTSVP